MCCNHRYSGVGLIVLGLFIAAASAFCHIGGRCHRAEFERHVAEVCVKAAEQVHK